MVCAVQAATAYLVSVASYAVKFCFVLTVFKLTLCLAQIELHNSIARASENSLFVLDIGVLT